MRAIPRDQSLVAPIPAPIVLYAALGLADFGFTIAAFMMGAVEANPVLRWFQMHGLFEFAKLSFTLLICCIAVRIWYVKHVPRVMTAANIAMTLLLGYHIALCMRLAGSL